jgi:hypothetical protein
MRLVAYEFANARAPVVGGFLQLADVTVLFGANDVGKSRLLQTIAEGARSLDALLKGEDFSGDHRFFVKLHPEDARLLLQATYRRYRAELGDRDGEEGGDLDEWLAHLPADARGLDPRSTTFALEALEDWCGKSPGAAAGLLVSWCRNPQPLAGPHSFGAGGTPMGTVQLPVLPVPVSLPVRDPVWLSDELADALSDWLAHVLWGTTVRSQLEQLKQADPHEADEMWLELVDQFDQAVALRRSAATWTIEDDEGVVAYRPIAQIACRFLSQLASALAPGFVRDRYDLLVEPVPLLAWASEGPIKIVFRATSDGRVFGHRDIADGLRLWSEISLIEAADAMRRVELMLRDNLLAIDRAPDTGHRHSAIDAYLAQLEAAIKTPVDPPFERTLGAAFDFASGMESPWRESAADALEIARRIASVRPRLYLLDEPERHLNPRLERLAAKWLIDLLRTRGSQGVIATHAHAFLNAGAGAAFVEVRREHDGGSRMVPFAPEEISAYSEIAREVGLDRGELLTSVRVLVFVEGRHDQAVLDELFKVPFHHAGVLVVPIAGVGRHAQIVEHEVLVRFTRARLAVVFDKLDADTVMRLLGDPEFRQNSLRARQTELQAMASLLHNAAANARTVQPLPLPADDIFDLLDAEIVVDQFPKFPGHEAANAAWLAARKRTPNRKVFYAEQYGIPNEVATYRRIAALMRSLDRIPSILRELGADLERMAAAQDD